MFNPRIFENSRPDGLPVLEIVERQGSGGGSERARLFVPLRQTDLVGEIVGPVATLRLTQRYRFSAEQFDRPVEAVYRFPLPGDAAVTGVGVRFGEVEIRAELAERATAEQEYQTARAEGRQAALLTRESPDVFTLQVSGIRPDEDVAVETSYAQLARPEGDGWSLRVPLTTAPRFVRGDERGSPFAEGQPLAVLRDPGHRFSLELVVEAGRDVTSPTHAIDVTEIAGPASQRAHVRLRDGAVLPDRDFVLSWRPGQDGAAEGTGAAGRPNLLVLCHDEPSGDAGCFLALVAPPGAFQTETLAREVLLLIDHSGSMSGPKWEAADWAVQNLLAGLTPRDSFNLGLFHTTTRWFAKQPVRADARTVQQARDFLLNNRDSGGTELGVALEQALRQPRAPAPSDGGPDLARYVLIVTDAQVSDAGRILALVEAETARADRRRVGVLCIDAAPNSGLANELAERGGGLARFLTSDPAENDIATALDEVLADWAAPVLANLTLEIDRPGVQAAGRRVSPMSAGRSAIDLGDLPAGRAVWVAGRIEARGASAPETPPTFTLRSGDREIAASRAASGEIPERRPGVAALFGARRVLDLELARSSGVRVEERLGQLGYDPDAVLGAPGGQGPAPLYPENVRARTADILHDLLVRESLRYGIACSATAFVATRREAGQQIAGTVAVGSALPHGWSSDVLLARAMPSAPLASPAPAAPPPTGRVFMQAESLDLGEPLDRLQSFARRLLGGGSSRARELHRFTSASGLSGSAPAPAGRARDGAPGGRSPAGPVTLFSGVPRFAGPEAVLFDSAQEPTRLPAECTLTRLVVRFPDGEPTAPLDAGLTLLLYVDDLTAPRARVRLADLLRQGGERPLNVKRQPGQIVRVVLLDPNGVWARGAPRLSVALA